MYDLGWVDRVVVLNRQDGNQARITCYQLELLDEWQNTIYSYPFTSTASSYTFRDPVNDAAMRASCSTSPPPPPMLPRPSTPICGGAAGEFIRYVRISWLGGCANANTAYLNVAELQVIYNGQNVAAGKGGNQLDTWTNSAAYNAAQLTDGKTWTMFHSGTVSSYTFVTVDLQVKSAVDCMPPLISISSHSCTPASDFECSLNTHQASPPSAPSACIC
jgi:hypothetical protein